MKGKGSDLLPGLTIKSKNYGVPSAMGPSFPGSALHLSHKSFAANLIRLWARMESCMEVDGEKPPHPVPPPRGEGTYKRDLS